MRQIQNCLGITGTSKDNCSLRTSNMVSDCCEAEAGKSEKLGKDWATYSPAMLKESANKKLRTGKRHGRVDIKRKSYLTNILL